MCQTGCDYYGGVRQARIVMGSGALSREQFPQQLGKDVENEVQAAIGESPNHDPVNACKPHGSGGASRADNHCVTPDLAGECWWTGLRGTAHSDFYEAEDPDEYFLLSLHSDSLQQPCLGSVQAKFSKE